MADWQQSAVAVKFAGGDQMNRATYVFPVLFTCLLAGCGESAPSKEAEKAKPAETKKDVIVLSPAEQVAGKIETQTVAMTDTPPVDASVAALRAPTTTPGTSVCGPSASWRRSRRPSVASSG
jgi:hypothetical protein